MVLTYNTLRKNIDYPVFLLPSGTWYLQDGLLILDELIIDDRNQEGKTLGARRMQTRHKDLHPIKKMIRSYNGILKQGTKYFIDNSGKPFMYEKTRFAKLIYIQIKRVEQKESASLIWLKGVKTPFTVPRPPEKGYSWAGILHLHGLPWVLYEYSETKLKDSRKKV